MEEILACDDIHMSFVQIAFSLKTKEEVTHLMSYFSEPFAKILLDRLAYQAGHLSDQERLRIEELFNIEHPYFGRMKVMGNPSPEEAMMCGFLRKTLKEVRDLAQEQRQKALQLIRIGHPISTV